MAEVITRLKVDNSGYDQKIKSAQRSLDQFGLKGTEVGQKMSGLTQMLNVNIGALSKWSVGLAAAGTALKVAGDAINSNEANVDEWGRITEASKSVYEGFLKALNTGSIDSYLSNIRSIISAARDAYDALDELGTFQAFNQVNQARNKAGYAAALDAFKLDPNDKNRQALKEANEKVLEDLKQEAKYAQNAYEKTLKQIAKENGMNTEEQEKAFMELFQGKSYAELLDAKAGFKHNRIGRDEYNGQSVTEVYGLGRYVDANGSIIRDMTAEENAAYKLAKALSALTDEEIREFQAKGMLAYNLQEAAATQDRSYNRLAGNTKTGGKEKNGLTMEQDVELTNREVLGMLDKPREGKGYVSVLEEEEDTYKEMYPLLLARRQAIDDINAKIAEMNNVLALSTDAGTKAWATDQLKAYTDELNRLNGVMDETGSKMDNFQTGFSAVQNIWGGFANSVDMVSNCIDTMTADAEENASAWQVLSSVIDTSFGVMNSVLGVIQAINTVTELSTALKTANTAATIADTAATIADTTATATHTSVETADAAATATSATAEGADAAAKAGKAVSWIPIVGPVLAVAAIAAVAAGIAASRSKTEYHATGGVVGGNTSNIRNVYGGTSSVIEQIFKPKGTDTVPAMLTPGEEVITRDDPRHIDNKGKDMLKAVNVANNSNTRNVYGGSSYEYVNSISSMLNSNSNSNSNSTEYHATGGVVGGNTSNTRNVYGGTSSVVKNVIVPDMSSIVPYTANVSQQNNLAGQLAGSASTQTVVVTGRISGKDILLSADNTNRSRGGSRGYYAKTH